jgi:hypothetical protein
VLNRIDVANDPVNWVDPWGLKLSDVFNTGTMIDAGGAVATTALEQAGKISPGAATATGIVTAPLSDLSLPNEASPSNSELNPLQDHSGAQMTNCYLSCVNSDSRECGEKPEDCLDRCRNEYNKKMKELSKTFPHR